MELGGGDISGSSDDPRESSGIDDAIPSLRPLRESDAHLEYSDPASSANFSPNEVNARGTENTQEDTRIVDAEAGDSTTDSLGNSGTVDNSPDSIGPPGIGHPHAPPHLQLEGNHLGEEYHSQYDDVLRMPGHPNHPIATWQQPGQGYFPPNLYGPASVGQNESVDRSTFYMSPYPAGHPGAMHLQQGYYGHPPPSYPGYPALSTLNGGYPGGADRSGVPTGNPIQQRPPDAPYEFNSRSRSHSQPTPGYPHPPQGQWHDSQPLVSGMEAHWRESRAQLPNQTGAHQAGHPGPELYRYQPYPVPHSQQAPPQRNEDPPSSVEKNDHQTRRSTPTTRQMRAIQDNRIKVKKHHCDTCPMQFERPSNLKVHQRIHTGARPFVCAECGRDFTTASNMTRHRRRIHPEVFADLRRSQSSGYSASQGPRQPSQGQHQQTVPQDMIRVETGGTRGQMPQESMFPGETSFHRQTFARDQSRQYASQRRSDDRSQGTDGDEYDDGSEHGNGEDSEEGDDNEGRQRKTSRGRK